MPIIRAETLIDSFKYAIEGVVYCLKTQRNMRIHTVFGILVFIAGMYFKVTRLELAILVIVSSSVVIAEMFNTAIESAIDLYSRQRHPLAKIAKDVAAAAVLLSAFSAAVVGLLILGPPFFSLVVKLLNAPLIK